MATFTPVDFDPFAPKPKATPSGVGKDVAKSAGSGLERGGLSILGAKGDIIDTLSNGLIGVGEKTGIINTQTGEQARAAVRGARLSGRVPGLGFSPAFLAPTSGELTAMTPGASYRAQTTPGRYASAIGEAAPAAAAPGGLIRRGMNVVLPAVTGEGAAELAENLGAGPKVTAAARFAGGLIGGVTASSRLSIRPRATGAEREVQGLMTRAPQDPAAMGARAAEYRAAGIAPTVIDVVDDSGRGLIHSAASRMTPARDEVVAYRDATALALPDRMSTQARRTVSADPRTPDEIRAELSATQRANANRNFGAVRDQDFTMPDETVQAMRSDHGREAIREAAKRERDPETRRRLLGLADAALDAPNTPVTVGMADRVSRVLLGRADAAARSGDNDLAATLGDLGRDIRRPAADAVPGYRAALDQFGADARLGNAATLGEELLTRNTDEFVDQASRLSDDERLVARAAARRAIERKSGENPSSAPAVARGLAVSREQQARSAGLMGQQDAGLMQDGMRLEERKVQNANAANPRSGSKTNLSTADERVAAGAAQAGEAALQVAHGNFFGVAMKALKSLGMTDREAESLARISIDPARTDEVIRIIAARRGPAAARSFVDWRQAAIAGTVATRPALSAGQPAQ